MNLSKISQAKLSDIKDFFYSFNISGTFSNNSNAISLIKQGRVYFVSIHNKQFLYLGTTMKDLKALFKFGGMTQVFDFFKEHIDLIKFDFNDVDYQKEHIDLIKFDFNDVDYKKEHSKLSVDDFKIFHEEISSVEFVKNEQFYSIGFYYSNGFDLVVYNESEKRRVRVFNMTKIDVNDLPIYVKKAINDSVRDFLSNEFVDVEFEIEQFMKKQSLVLSYETYKIIYNNIIDCLNCGYSVRLLMANLKNKLNEIYFLNIDELNEKYFLNIDELNLYSNDMTYYNIISDIAISKLNEDKFLFDSDKKFYIKLLFKVKLLILKEMKELHKHDNFSYYEFLPVYDPIENRKETLNKLGNLLFTINSFCEKYKI